MNCKKGDLAIVVKSRAGNAGKIVQCIRLATEQERDMYDFGNYYFDGEVWVVDKPLRTVQGYSVPLVHDAALRPLRDNGEEDEVPRMVGLPKPAKAAA